MAQNPKKPKKPEKPKKPAGRGAAKSKYFEQAKTRAEGLLRSPDALKKLVRQAETKSESSAAGGPLSEIIDQVKALLRMVRAYANGSYRSVSWESMVLIVGALIYLVSPIDVIPDFLPLGLVDDAGVLAFVIAMVAKELVEFQLWEAAQKSD